MLALNAMVSSTATSVEAYLAQLEDANIQSALTDLHHLVGRIMPDYVPSMEYKMPTYRNGDRFFAFAAQKQYTSLYVGCHDIVARHALRMAGVSHGKSCLRFRNVANIHLDQVESLLREVYVD